MTQQPLQDARSTATRGRQLRTGFTIIALALLAICPQVLLAVTPPARLNYQGVLRDAADSPLDGSYDMVFRFWSSETGGSEILIDRYLAINSQSVTVSGGLFSVDLGTGEILDGAGPGIYSSLAEVFGAYDSVWLELQVGAETLTPRTLIDSAPYALNASQLAGRKATEFIDTSATAQTKSGALSVSASNTAISGAGTTTGGHFSDSNSSGYANVGTGDIGIMAYGTSAGGYFEDSDQSGHASVGTDDLGIRAFGNVAGGYFKDNNSSGYAYAAYGDGGITAYGASYGGYFKDSDSSGRCYAGYGDTGAACYASTSAGYFYNTSNGAYSYLGRDYYGVKSYGTGSGGGGYFKHLDNSAYTYVAGHSYGVSAYGATAGGYFKSLSTNNYAYVGYSTYKIYGTGSVNFVQNHPEDPGLVLVYTAPEGDETAVYTRGSGRLIDGKAVVQLGETFQWVANPDIGLTAYLTPREECQGLMVAALTTDRLVVRELGGGTSNAAFDFIVYGLRIGFEETPVVDKKQVEAYIPSMAEHRQLFASRPDLGSYTAFERFRATESSVFGRPMTSEAFSRADALRGAVHEFDPTQDKLVSQQPAGAASAPADAPLSLAAAGPGLPLPGNSGGTAAPSPVANDDSGSRDDTHPDGDEEDLAWDGTLEEHDACETRDDSCQAVMDWYPVSGPVERGDLLALDPLHPGHFRRAEQIGDPAVVGVAAGPDRPADTEDDGSAGAERVAAVLSFGIVEVRVDAGYGSIRPGDLLVSSATPGRAMVAPEVVPGTVIGKALESLESGTGTIRMLIMPR